MQNGMNMVFLYSSWIVTLDVLKFWNTTVTGTGSWIVTLDVLKYVTKQCYEAYRRSLNSNIRCIEIS